MSDEDWKALYSATHYWNKCGVALMKQVLEEVKLDPDWHNDPERMCLIDRMDRWVENKE